ncbi:PIN domain-containing protein [Consotaella aegiceratis]|uniref:PIN domain-containing protein n=1 Tax=Consotaella aegiceratis TaxID=3097961 RepID=UPI002F40869E
MVGIDTNILLRAVLDDDPVQSPKAHAFLAALTLGDPGYITLPVAMEFYWVLVTRYRVPSSVIASLFSQLFAAATIEFANLDSLVEALYRSTTQNADFADAVIAGLAWRAGCVATMTFDKRAASRLPTMELLA